MSQWWPGRTGYVDATDAHRFQTDHMIASSKVIDQWLLIAPFWRFRIECELA